MHLYFIFYPVYVHVYLIQIDIPTIIQILFASCSEEPHSVSTSFKQEPISHPRKHDCIWHEAVQLNAAELITAVQANKHVCCSVPE